MKKRWMCTMSGLFLSAFVFFHPAAAGNLPGDDIYYIENEWNFVDGSMDVEEGIPSKTIGVLNRIWQNGVLKVAIDPSYAPYCFQDPENTQTGGYGGADLELAGLIAKKMGVTLKILPMDSMQLLPALTEEQCDLSISAIAFSPSRALSYALSKAYYYPETSTDVGFIIREADAAAYEGLEDFEDKVIVAQSKSLSETVGIRQLTNYQEFCRVNSAKAVYESVKQKTADAGIVEIKTARAYFQSDPDCGLRLVDGLVFAPGDQYLGLRVAGKKGENQLLYFVNGVINEVVEQGLYKEWLQDCADRVEELGLE